MCLVLNLILLLVLVTSCLAKCSETCKGYQIHRVTPRTRKQLSTLQQLENHPNGLDFWTSPVKVGRSVDIMVSPRHRKSFKSMINKHNFNRKVSIRNLQTLINMERRRTTTSDTFDWEDYYGLQTIYDWLGSLVKRYPGIVTPIIGGKTYENRKIRGVKVSYGRGKRGAFLEGGIHAREWISPATVTYILNALLTSNRSAVRDVARSRDWYVFPVTNPDGYFYSHADKGGCSTCEMRMWRKSRKPYGGPCYGADLNRNWDYHWMGVGASNSCMAETFAGSHPFSEVETLSLSKFITSIAQHLDSYISFHSYSQYLMFPFGHEGMEKPKNYNELLKIGKAAVRSLYDRYGTFYKVGMIPDVLTFASGTSLDWVMGKHRHIRLVYVYELRDQGWFRFALPPEQIVPTGEETLDSFITIFQKADKVLKC